MDRPIIFVIKDEKMTLMMQHLDLFESFKFVGRLLHFKQAQSYHHFSAQEVLERALKVKKDDDFSVVGVIIPNVNAAFVPNHKVLSNCEQWTTVEKICESYNALIGD